MMFFSASLFKFKSIILLLLVFLASCKIENEATSFNVTISALKGTEVTFKTKEEVPVKISYNVSLNEDSIDPWIRLEKGPSFGELSNCINPNNYTIVCDYLPNKDFYGLDKVVLKIGDGDLISKYDATILIEVSNVPDRPLIEDINLSIKPGSSKNFEVKAIDPDRTKLTYEILSVDPVEAVSRLKCTGANCVYNSLVTETRDVNAVVRVENESGLSSNANIVIKFVPFLAPIVNSEIISIAAGQVASFNFKAQDINDPKLGVNFVVDRVVPESAKSNLSCNRGSCTYRSSILDQSSVFIYFKAINDAQISADGKVTINVSKSTAPIADNQSINIKAGENKSFSFTGRDTNTPPQKLNYSLLSVEPSKFQSQVSCSQSNCNFKSLITDVGNATVRFKVENEAKLSTVGSITFNIGSSSAPTATAQTINLKAGEIKSFILQGRDTNTPVQKLTYSIISVTPNSQNSKLTCNLANCTYRSAFTDTGKILVDFKVTNEAGLTKNATVTLDIEASKGPAGTNQTINLKAGDTKSFTLQGKDLNTPAQKLTYSIVSVSPDANKSKLTCNQANCTYKSLISDSGKTIVTFKVTNEANLSHSAAVTLDLEGGKTPTATGQNIKFVAGQTKTFTLQGQDNNTPAQKLTYSIVSVSPDANKSKLTCTQASCTYKSLMTDSGNVTVNFKVTNEANLSSTATVILNIEAIKAPTATAQTISIKAGETKTFTLQGQDNNTPAQNLTYSIVSVSPDANRSKLTCSQASCTYKSLMTDSGQVNVTFRVKNEANLTHDAKVTLNVSAMAAPTATAQTVSLKAGETKAFTLQGRDNNTPAQRLTYSIISVSPDANKTKLTCNQATCSYKSSLTDSGIVTVTFRVTNEANLTHDAVVTLNVSAIAAPTATAQTVTLNAGETKSFTLGGRDNNTPALKLTYSIISVSPDANRSKLTCSQANCTYKSALSDSGKVTITFRVTNEANLSHDAVVTLDVNSIKAPTANEQTITMVAGDTRAFTLTGRDNNTPAQKLTYSVISVTPSSNSSKLTCNLANCAYKSVATDSGKVIIKFRATNESNLSHEASITLEIIEVKGPKAVNGSISLESTTSKSFTLSGSDTNTPPLPITFSIKSVTPSDAKDNLTCNDKNCTYKSTKANESRTITVNFIVKNSKNITAEGIFTISVGKKVFKNKIDDQINKSGVNILWVIDDSGSMQTYQNHLAESFSSFIDNFTRKATYVYDMKIIKTSSYLNGDFVKKENGSDYDFSSTRAARDLNNMKTEFKKAVNVGVGGSATEKVFSSVESTYNKPSNSSWFDKDNRSLIVIALSDELEQSFTAESNLTYPPVGETRPITKALTASDWLQKFKAMNIMMFYPIVSENADDTSCEKQPRWDYSVLDHNKMCETYKFKRFLNMANSYGGLRYSLNNSFDSILDNISKDILEKMESYHIPVDHVVDLTTLVVKVNGTTQVINKDFTISNNFINFSKKLADNSKVTIEYSYTYK